MLKNDPLSLSPFHSHADPDQDPAFHSDADPDPAFHFDADPDAAFHFGADPDPTFQSDADLYPITHFFQIWTLQCSKSTFLGFHLFTLMRIRIWIRLSL
jgi:hypothetical protein